MRILFKGTLDQEVKSQINILEKAFRGPITPAINRELNLVRRNAITGHNLLETLGRIYHQHNMRQWVDRKSLQSEDYPIPRIVCSEALVGASS